ncbi:Replication protein P [Pseudomonas fluorescens HK44]|uniref:Replication protein P n=1 Tax=Pseudomonas fluorescens HK44 TaxID=1042209 RepID=A0A010SSM7_PSEFL|nr:replication protein P [Pseudomonas fluorescens]EXF95780.1 Replication protein P [Pseudomonas fluorescens HK44]
MRIVKSVTPAAAKAIRTGQGSAPAPVQLGNVDSQTAEVVEKIFRQLKAIFPAWKTAWPDEKALGSAQRSWTKGFIDAGICDINQVEFGIKQCRKSGSPFAPSIGQFIQWCTPGPAAYGMPAAADAWMEALMGTASHEAVRIAANATGIFDLRSAKQDDKAMRARFERNYEIVLRRAQSGQPLDGKILTGIGHDSQKSQLELADELADQQTQERIAKQGIPSDGASARAQLMAKFGKRSAQ